MVGSALGSKEGLLLTFGAAVGRRDGISLGMRDVGHPVGNSDFGIILEREGAYVISRVEEKGPLLADSIVGNKLFSLGCSGNLEEEVDEIGSLVGFALVGGAMGDGDSLLMERKG